MSPSHLRRGNLVNYRVDGNIITIEAKDILEGERMDIRVWSIIYKPILLTDGWLLRFGFEKDADNNFETKDVLIQYWSHKNEFYYVTNHGLLCKRINYIHELQNLYFALTGEELNHGDRENLNG